MKPIIATLVALIATGLLVASQTAWGEESTPDPVVTQVASHGTETGMAGMGHESGMVVVPANPTDGVLSIVIPPGTDAAMKRAGNAGYHMPSIIRLHIGDTIVIRNDDSAPHMILYTFLLPGQTDIRTFTEVGSEAYSSGCAANAAEFPDFTTIFVVDQ